MRYKEDNDNRYRVNFMRATEELMDALTVESFISYLEENAEFEDYTVEYIDGKCVKCRAYDLTEENSKLHKEFLVTEDGRVFYWRTLLDKIELVDDEIPEGMVEGLQEELGVSRRTLRMDIAYLKRVYPDKLITHRGRYTGGLEWVE